MNLASGLMALYGTQPAVTKVEITSKKIGSDETRTHRVGTTCKVQRSQACLGEFQIWFPGHHYITVNAVALFDYVSYST